MKIIDEYGKEREAEILAVITHETENGGELVPVNFLKIKIIGKIFNWDTFIPLDKFRELNPNIEV